MTFTSVLVLGHWLDRWKFWVHIKCSDTSKIEKCSIYCKLQNVVPYQHQIKTVRGNGVYWNWRVRDIQQLLGASLPLLRRAAVLVQCNSWPFLQRAHSLKKWTNGTFFLYMLKTVLVTLLLLFKKVYSLKIDSSADINKNSLVTLPIKFVTLQLRGGTSFMLPRSTFNIYFTVLWRVTKTPRLSSRK